MAWVVDSCVLIDVAIADPMHGRSSADCLQSSMRQGLIICPISYIEIGPVFDGDRTRQERFLDAAGIDWQEPWTSTDTALAHSLWSQFIHRKRRQRDLRRSVADVLIGAFAARFDGLITRNGRDFRSLCPGLKLVQP